MPKTKSLVELDGSYWNLEQVVRFYSSKEYAGDAYITLKFAGDDKGIRVVRKHQPEAYAIIKSWLAANTIKTPAARSAKKLNEHVTSRKSHPPQAYG